MKNLLQPGTKCLLVDPRHPEHSFWNYAELCRLIGTRYLTPPLGLMTVAALLPQDWCFRLVDENVEALTDEEIAWADVVCTGGMLTQSKGILAVIERAQRLGKPVAVGGPDPTLRPEVYEAAEFLVMGEGELSIPLWMKDLSNGSGCGRYRPEGYADLFLSPIPRFDLMTPQHYLYRGIQFSRGCPHGCEFCDIAVLSGRHPRTKAPDQVLAELQALHDLGCRHEVLFVDDNLTANRKPVKEFLHRLEEWLRERGHPFYFACQASVDIAHDEELLDLLRRVDVRFAFIGLETPETEALSAMGKSPNLRRDLLVDVKRIQACGINVDAGFILGSDGDSPGVAQAMLDFIVETGIPLAMVGLLHVLPGTPLAERLRRENRLPDESTLSSGAMIGDQSLHGLNFITVRPRADILNDLAWLLERLYAPAAYFTRVTTSSLRLRPPAKRGHTLKGTWRDVGSFLAISGRLGLRRETARLYWQTLLTVLLRNPRGIENAVSMMALYVHLGPHMRFAVEHLRSELRTLPLPNGRASS
jgi:radical SAM superfamily enzyme YgiQ (UPF0313 family)